MGSELEKLALNLGVTGRFARRMSQVSEGGIEALKKTKSLGEAKSILKHERRAVRLGTKPSAATTIKSKAMHQPSMLERAQDFALGRKQRPGVPRWAKDTAAAQSGREWQAADRAIRAGRGKPLAKPKAAPTRRPAPTTARPSRPRLLLHPGLAGAA